MPVISGIGPQSPATAVIGSAALPANPTFRQIYVTPSGMFVCLVAGTWTLLEAGGIGNVTGTGTNNRLTKWTNGAGSVIGDSLLSDDATTLIYTGSGGFKSPLTTLGTASSVTGSLKLANASTANLTTIQGGNAASALTFVWPVVNPTSGQALLASAPSGSTVTLSWGAAGITNGAGANVLPKSDGTNLVASSLTDNATNILSTEPIAVGFGATTPPSGPMVMVASTVSTSPRGILSAQFSSDTSGARVGFQKARGTVASPTTVVTGDTLGRLMFRGYDGTNYLEMGSIESVSTGTIGTGRVPTQLIFSTATDAATSVLTTALTIGADQKSTFAGNVLIPAGSGSPSFGSASTPTTGINFQSDTSIRGYISGGQVFAASASTFNISTTLGLVNGQTILSSPATANLQLGAAAAASPVAQTLSVQNVVTGTSNTAGANFTINGSQGTGTGAGGSIIFQTAPAGSTGTSVNALATNVTILSTGNVKIAGTAVRGTTEGTNHLDIFNGTSPAGTLTNGISLYSSSGELNVMDAAGNATLLSPHDLTTNEWIFYSRNTVTGRIVKIDMERMMRFLNSYFGTDFVHEFTSESEARPDLRGKH